MTVDDLVLFAKKVTKDLHNTRKMAALVGDAFTVNCIDKSSAHHDLSDALRDALDDLAPRKTVFKVFCLHLALQIFSKRVF